MSRSRSASVITLTFDPPPTRWLLLLPAVLALLGAWFAVRWYAGDTIAENTPAAEEGGVEMAQLAVRWAPNDPLTHWRLASFEMKNFSAENIAAAVQEYQLAVKAAPYDFRYWMELGRALEASGDRDGGEKALLHAVELAPAYAYPRWHYGNLLLRQGRIDEAFAQLARAAEADNGMQPPVFALANQVFGDDVEHIVRILPTPAVRMRFAMNLINTDKFEGAARVLRMISPADRKAQSDVTDEILKALIGKKQFRAALSIIREIEPDASQLPALNQVWNGGFETNIASSDPNPFHWLLDSRPQAQPSIDTHAHSGGRSLQISFSAPNKLDAIAVSQTITVEPDTSYRIQFYQRTDKLVSAATPSVTITDEVNGGPLAISQPAPSGTNEWRQVTVDFKTRPRSDGISIGFTRGSCSDAKEICPIFGTVWYDDFNLQRVNGPGSAGGDAGTNNR